MSVNFSVHANTLAIGSPGRGSDDADRPGYVRVFFLEGDKDLGTDTWNQIGQDLIREANGNEFGSSVSHSNDVKTIAVGARHAYVIGESREFLWFSRWGDVSVYRMADSESGWIQLGNDIDGKAACDCLGWTVPMSGDGSKVAIGSPYNSDNGVDSGHVRGFVFG